MAAQALSLLLPTCAAEKNVRILAALFMRLRFQGEGVEGVLSYPIWFHFLLQHALGHTHNSYKTKLFL